MNEFATPFDQDYSGDLSEPINNVNSRELQEKYNLDREQMNEYENHVLSIHDKNATIHDLEVYIKSLGYVPIYEKIEEENNKEIQLPTGIKLASMKDCQKLWGTSLKEAYFPSRHINSKKGAPLVTYMAISMMTGKQGNDLNDRSGKGARIMNVKRRSKLCEVLMQTRGISKRTIDSHINKLLKLKTKEFEQVTLENSRGNQELYYRLDYSDGYVTIDLRIADHMIAVYSNNVIRTYIILQWICRDKGWNQLTQEQLANHLGLKEDSRRNAGKYINQLVHDGFIKQRSKYQYKTIIKDGMPRECKVPYYEYKIVELDDLEEEQ